MIRLTVLWRAAVMVLACVIPFTLIGALIGGAVVALVVAVAALAVLTLVGLTAEAISFRLHLAADDPPGHSWLTSKAFESRARPRPMPAVRIFPEPDSKVIVVRSVGGRGLILLSQGMVSRMSEDELIDALRVGAERLSQPEIVVQSVSTILAAVMLAIAPPGWGRLVSGHSSRWSSSRAKGRLGPLSAVLFFAMLPALVLFIKLSRLPDGGSLLLIGRESGKSY